MSKRIVVVTGGAGFIGSNIVARLCDRAEFDVVVVDWLETADSGKWRNLSKHPVCDIWAPEELFEKLDAVKNRVTAIIHMGAISSTTEPDADMTLRTNFGLTRDVWNWCAQSGVRLIYASSAATYGDGDLGFNDDNTFEALSSLRPLNAYGYSKYLFDQYAIKQAEADHAPPQWVGLKFFNVYGPNEYHKGSMKSVVAQIFPDAQAGKPVKLFKSHREGFDDGGQLRDFVYVDDIVDIVDWLMDRPDISGIYNAGSGQARSFADLARATFAAASKADAIEYIDMPESIRDRYQYFTEARMERLRAAGYEKPMTSLEEGVRRYVQDFLSQPDPYR
ncbi:ADP-glyceromanno-heptose 6-epimerase [Brevundimonas sp.]|uniref:ADP-glyceromanno-heptose 6-epimerase n=1 Tax=Brevundimonas sp. TaxID=1871086 RepID=UPI0028991925|nr:ADP-glyceromanno-heptose 6-epimerase [Brevundimonas sp.]